MAAATFLAIFFVPMFYVMVERVFHRGELSKKELASTAQRAENRADHDAKNDTKAQEEEQK